eukprot:g2371.t1
METSNSTGRRLDALWVRQPIALANKPGVTTEIIEVDIGNDVALSFRVLVNVTSDKYPHITTVASGALTGVIKSATEPRNYVKAISTREFKLRVNSKPEVLSLSRLPTGSVEAGTSVTFMCHRTGDPSPGITWYRHENGQALKLATVNFDDGSATVTSEQQGAGKHAASANTLEVKAVKPTDTLPRVLYSCSASNAAGSDTSPKHLHGIGMGTKAKILLGFYQCATAIVSNFEIPWPKHFTNFIANFNFINLDLPTLALGCMPDLTFIDKFLSAVLVPLLLCFPFVCIGAVAEVAYVGSGEPRHDSHGKLNPVLRGRNFCIKLVFFLLFLIYPSTSSSILHMWDCISMRDGHSYLRSDMSIMCEAGGRVESSLLGDRYTYGTYYNLSIFFTFVYPIGVPVLFFYTLYMYRKDLYVSHTTDDMYLVGAHDHEKSRPNPEVADEIGFLYAGYTPECWWWECVELLRKLTLTGLIVFIMPNTPEQLFITVVLTLCFIVGYARWQPYNETQDDDLQLVCQLQLWFTSLSGLAVKFTTMPAPLDLASGNETTVDNGDSFVQTPVFDSILVFLSVAPFLLIIGQLVMTVWYNLKRVGKPKDPAKSAKETKEEQRKMDEKYAEAMLNSKDRTRLERLEGLCRHHLNEIEFASRLEEKLAHLTPRFGSDGNNATFVVQLHFSRTAKVCKYVCIPCRIVHFAGKRVWNCLAVLLTPLRMLLRLCCPKKRKRGADASSQRDLETGIVEGGSSESGRLGPGAASGEGGGEQDEQGAKAGLLVKQRSGGKTKGHAGKQSKDAKPKQGKDGRGIKQKGGAKADTAAGKKGKSHGKYTAQGKAANPRPSDQWKTPNAKMNNSGGHTKAHGAAAKPRKKSDSGGHTKAHGKAAKPRPSDQWKTLDAKTSDSAGHSKARGKAAKSGQKSGGTGKAKNAHHAAAPIQKAKTMQKAKIIV